MPIVLLAAVIAILLAPAPPATPSSIDQKAGPPSATSGLVAVRGAATSPRWRAPIRGTLVVRRGFTSPNPRWSPGHRGVDLAATPGTSIHAAGPGRVVFAGMLAGRGVVSIEHSPGVRTTYEPVRAHVASGDFVRIGDTIGFLSPDRRHRDRLHWGLRIRDGYADPMRLLQPRPTLKPAR